MWRQSKFNEYLQKLKGYYFLHRTIPSFTRLTELFNVSSKRTVHSFFQQCLEWWYVIKDDNQYIATNKLSGLPLFWAIPAGNPDEASDEKEDDIDISNLMINNPVSTVLLKAQWDSMIDAGILSWDMMVVDTKKSYHEGDIVIGVVDNDYTVKYLHQNKNKTRYLKAANSIKNYPDIYADNDLSIYGVVTGIVRKI